MSAGQNATGVGKISPGFVFKFISKTINVRRGTGREMCCFYCYASLTTNQSSLGTKAIHVHNHNEVT